MWLELKGGSLGIPCNPYKNISYSATYLRIEYLQVFISDGNSIICYFYNEWGN
jgi:hypothetical protein